MAECMALRETRNERVGELITPILLKIHFAAKASRTVGKNEKLIVGMKSGVDPVRMYSSEGRDLPWILLTT